MKNKQKVHLPGESESSLDTTVKHVLGHVDRYHPIGGEMADVLQGILQYVRLPWLLTHYSHIVVLAVFSFLSGCLSIGLMSALAVITHSPFIFPSLGPSAFLFFYTPMASSASPRNTLLGHAIGIGAGYLSLVITGLTQTGSAIAIGVTWPRVIADALALGLTSGIMVLLRVPHPPAAATALIISLGLLAYPWQLGLLMGGVALLTLQALIINRLAGIPYPLWGPPREPLTQGKSHTDRAQTASLLDGVTLTVFLIVFLTLTGSMWLSRHIKERLKNR
ncbi:MAG: HPP family protein [Ktedonobacteraceae bacterium]